MEVSDRERIGVRELDMHDADEEEDEEEENVCGTAANERALSRKESE